MRAVLLVVVVLLGARPALAEGRADQLVGMLRAMCMIEPPNFTTIDAVAGVMRLPVLTEFAPPGLGGVAIRSKTWLLGVGGKTLALSASEATGGAGPTSTCSLAAADTSVGEVRAALVAVPQIGQPTTVTSRDGQAELVKWDHLEGGMTLTVVPGRFSPAPGVLLIVEGGR